MKKKYTVRVKKNTSRSGGEICKGQEDDRWPNYEDAHEELKSVEFFSEFHGKEYYTEEFEIESNKFPDKLYAVIVRYYDGGTFGRTTGYTHISGIFLNISEANSIVEKIESKEYEKDSTKYLPWKGYFAGLERVYVKCIESLCTKEELKRVEENTKALFPQQYEINEETMLFEIYDSDFAKELEKYLEDYSSTSHVKHTEWSKEWFELNGGIIFNDLCIKIGLSLAKFYKENNY